MFSFLENAKIGARIALALVLPIVGMLIFSGMTILDKRSVVSEMDSLQELAELAPSISALVHELQKERGTSAVFIGSKGTKFVKELPEQWALSSQVHADLNTALTSFNAKSFGTNLVNKVATATEALEVWMLPAKGWKDARLRFPRWPVTTPRQSPNF